MFLVEHGSLNKICSPSYSRILIVEFELHLVTSKCNGMNLFYFFKFINNAYISFVSEEERGGGYKGGKSGPEV